jgi:hypothetical protein
LVRGVGHDSIRPDTGRCADQPLPAGEVAMHLGSGSAI